MSVKPKTQLERLTFLEREVAELRADQVAVLKQQRETHDSVQALHHAFMEVQPGHSKTLLERIAIVTIEAERGQWGLRALVAVGSTIIVAGGALAVMRNWFGGN
jgi:hypothetical protein